MVEIGGPIRSQASFRIFGETLDPAAVTQLLGCEPTFARTKGEIIRGKQTGLEVVQRTGSWHLQSEPRDSEDLNRQITEILNQMTPDPAVWAALAKEFRLDFFCGLFLRNYNQGLVLMPGLLSLLGNRGIELSFDIYNNESDDDEVDAPDSSNHLH